MRWRLHRESGWLGADSHVRPNRAHLAVVDLWRAGRMSGCVTQNIDGLHQDAGLPDDLVAELHGNVRKSGCMSCPAQWPTAEVLRWVEAGQEDPACPHCGGMVKTATLSFGQMLPVGEIQKARFFSAMADGILVTGSTPPVHRARSPGWRRPCISCSFRRWPKGWSSAASCNPPCRPAAAGDWPCC